MLIRLRQLYLHHDCKCDVKEKTPGLGWRECNGGGDFQKNCLGRVFPSNKKKRRRDTLGENAHSCHWMLRCLELQQSSCAHEVKARRMAKKLTQKLDIVELN